MSRINGRHFIRRCEQMGINTCQVRKILAAACIIMVFTLLIAIKLTNENSPTVTAAGIRAQGPWAWAQASFHGLRIGRDRMALAWASCSNCSAFGSHRSLRPVLIAILAR